MKKKYYLCINKLCAFYSDPDVYNKIAAQLKQLNEKKLKKSLHSTLEDAQASDNFNKNPITGIIEIEMDDDASQVEQVTQAVNELEKNQAASILKSIHVNGFSIPAEQIALPGREAAHVKQLHYDPQHSEALQLHEPPLVFLSKLNPELRFLYFIDYKFFDYYLQNWRHWDNREPGSMRDLFATTATLIGDYLSTTAQEPFSLDQFKQVHASISRALSQSGIELKRGELRQSYTAVSLSRHQVTKEGIKELLLRIQKDKETEGFIIGEQVTPNIVSKFCNQISELIYKKNMAEAQGGKNLPEEWSALIKEFHEMKEEAINHIHKNLLAEKYAIRREDIEPIIDQFLNSKLTHDFFNSNDIRPNYRWMNLRTYFDDSATSTAKVLTKAEHAFVMDYSRKHAPARAGGNDLSLVDISRYTDKELDQLADTLIAHLNTGKNIFLFPPEIHIAEKWAQAAITEYNNRIGSATTAAEKIQLIDNLVHELENCHLFNDGNLRTCCLTQNLQLLANGMKWTMLYEPFRMHALTSEQRVEQVKMGIFRTQYVCDHAKELLEKNATIDEIFLSRNMSTMPSINAEPESSSASATDYMNNITDISKPLDERLQQFKNQFDQKIDSLIDTYSKHPATEHSLFAVKGFGEDCRTMMHTALTNLRKDYDMMNFSRAVREIEQNDKTSVHIKNDIRTLKNMSGYHEGWSHTTPQLTTSSIHS